MTRRETALKALDDLGISYSLCEHKPVNSIDDCAAPERALDAMMPRNIFLCTANRKRFVLLLCRPHAVFRTSSVSRQAGMSRLSFAPEAEIGRLLGAYPGAVSPLGLIYDKNHEVRLLMDEKLFKEESLLFHPLDNTCSVKVKTQAFTDSFLQPLGYEICRVNMEQIEQKS